jgi:hypothetical protein
MQNTNWPAFGIGMAAGVALSVSLYFGWSLLRPAPREVDNGVANAIMPPPLDENALVAANAERPVNAVRPPPQLQPGGLQPEAEPAPAPVRPEPPVVRPTPRPEPYEPPPEDDPPPDDDDGGKPQE